MSRAKLYRTTFGLNVRAVEASFWDFVHTTFLVNWTRCSPEWSAVFKLYRPPCTPTSIYGNHHYPCTTLIRANRFEAKEVVDTNFVHSTHGQLYKDYRESSKPSPRLIIHSTKIIQFWGLLTKSFSLASSKMMQNSNFSLLFLKR